MPFAPALLKIFLFFMVPCIFSVFFFLSVAYVQSFFSSAFLVLSLVALCSSFGSFALKSDSFPLYCFLFSPGKGYLFCLPPFCCLCCESCTVLVFGISFSPQSFFSGLTIKTDGPSATGRDGSLSMSWRFLSACAQRGFLNFCAALWLCLSGSNVRDQRPAFCFFGR